MPCSNDIANIWRVCDDGLVCDNGICVEPARCTDISDCDRGQDCVNDACVVCECPDNMFAPVCGVDGQDTARHARPGAITLPLTLMDRVPIPWIAPITMSYAMRIAESATNISHRMDVKCPEAATAMGSRASVKPCLQLW